ncbi:hypothetical protein RhiirA5_354103 [Rhizophagus irregularis]|uniref:Uncharacterized protein n=1 Tax=Rhizophagus irregularis TaxID=588596 RepID=A0A2I1EGV9_9GLOM|nr:hypothetical protein RhiirA5_354103 [Rhizophagus irregularis]PKC65578.1 hypothetical protein RhiirA1_420292 [Rhizophagus irregularis]PKY21366.1 hypothetical protein RhiirB3_409384 [Rhizophagus irregularis]
MTIQSPDMHDGLGVSAIGHFSMHVDNIMAEFDLPTPTKGTWFDIWISIYWSCINVSARRSCQSQDVHYYGYVK